MRVFVTGARGFVGPRLCARLAQMGAEVLAVDRDVDVTDARCVAEAVVAAAPDRIVHLAALSSVEQSFEDPAGFYRVNFVGVRSVLRAAAQHAPRARVLLVSSGQIYGSTPAGAPPTPESAPLRPASPYARSKAAADLLGAVWARRGLDIVRARPFNHTGPGQPDTYAASSFARQLAEIEAERRPPCLLVGNLASVRDFLDVEDVVEAYLRLLDTRVPAGVYNIARGSGVSIRALIEALLTHARVRPEIRVDPGRVRGAEASVGDPSRLRAATGWQPEIPLSDTLARLLDDWRARVSAT